MDRPPAIALLGLGEAGAEIARDLVAAGADVRGHDPEWPRLAPAAGPGVGVPRSRRHRRPARHDRRRFDVGDRDRGGDPA